MEISNKILSDITVYMKYAKFVPELNRRETWNELVTRNMNMHIKKYPELEEQIQEASFVITEKQKPKNSGPRTYTAHNLSEVCAIIPDAAGNRDIIVNRRGGGIQQFQDTIRAADPLHLVLLHSKGHDG